MEEAKIGKICVVVGMLAVLFGGVASVVRGNWIEFILWAALWFYQVLWYIKKKDLEFWRNMATACMKDAEDALDLSKEMQEKYRAALRSLKESDEIISILDKEDAAIRYIKTKARMCGGCKNCVGCPLKEAGRNVSSEELNTEGCQHMKWCELYEFLHPAEAAALVLKWEEEHAKG